MQRAPATLQRVHGGPRAARKSEWLRSALEHHYSADRAAENEVVVLATGIDQYLQEVFHHLAHATRGDAVSAEDFTELCALLGLTGERRKRREEEEEEEEEDACSELPQKLTFKDFHSRLCAFFCGNAAGRVPVSADTELVERQISTRWPRRRRRRKSVSFDLTDGGDNRQTDRSERPAEDPQTEELAALRELVEDLRSALQGSDARCIALEVALRRERSRLLPPPPGPGSKTPPTSRLLPPPPGPGSKTPPTSRLRPPPPGPGSKTTPTSRLRPNPPGPGSSTPPTSRLRPPPPGPGSSTPPTSRLRPPPPDQSSTTPPTSRLHPPPPGPGSSTPPMSRLHPPPPGPDSSTPPTSRLRPPPPGPDSSTPPTSRLLPPPSSAPPTSITLVQGKLLPTLRLKGGGGGGAARRTARRRDLRDPLLRELKLIRSSRDGQLEEAMRFNQRLEEEVLWSYQEVHKLQGVESALRKENATIRRRAEEAREALSLGLQRVRLIQEQAQRVPQLQTTITQLETQLQTYRLSCSCISNSSSQTECLQRAVEGRAASDEEEEERGRREEGERCLLEEKKQQNKGSENINNQNVQDFRRRSREQNDRLRNSDREKRCDEDEEQKLSDLEEKLTDGLTLLLQLHNKKMSRGVLGRIVMETLNVCSRSGDGSSHVFSVSDVLRVQLDEKRLVQPAGSSTKNPPLVSC